MTAEQLQNQTLFAVVNQLTLDEFKRYTNFVNIVETLFNDCSETELCIQLNFEKNIPSKSLWEQGGFSSLKLSADFYESDLAGRIFSKIYGTKPCHVALDVLNEDDVNCIPESSGKLNAAKGTISCGVKKNILQKGSVDPNASNAVKNCRNAFNDHMKHVEKQFEKYLTDTDCNMLSLNDFWHEYTSLEYTNGWIPATSPTTPIDHIATDIKMEDPIHIVDVVVESDSSDSEIAYAVNHRNSVAQSSSEESTAYADEEPMYEQDDASPPSQLPYENSGFVMDEQIEIIDLSEDSEEDTRGSLKRSSPVGMDVIPEKRRPSTCKLF